MPEVPGPAASGPGHLAAAPLRTRRLHLEPLRVEHAEEVAAALDDEALHAFTGGSPSGPAALRVRYERLVLGRSGDGAQSWLNWVLRRADDARVVGTVQATASRGPQDELTAELAWVVASDQQGRGFAREAASAVATWLRGRGAVGLLAHVHPDHRASAAVARAVGLSPTGELVDGEVRWRG